MREGPSEARFTLTHCLNYVMCVLYNIQERDAYLNTLHTAEEVGVVAALSSSHLPLAEPGVQLSRCDRCCSAPVWPSPPRSHFDSPSLVEECILLF